MDGQVTWSDLGFSFGRTLSEHSAATEEKTSTPCWKKLRVSQNQDFLYLDCRKSGNGQKQEPSTVMGGLSPGELTTLRTGEKPSETAVQEMLSVWGPHSVAEESRLSQILEVNPLPKYNLTAKACQGILRRAERRGKDLPERLKAVLLMQSASGGGCDGGGKGALVQTEKSGTLGTGNDQTIFTPTPINLMVATRCKALGRGTGFGVGEPGDPANTISAAHSHGVFATAIPINDKATRWQGGGESRNHDGSGNGLGIGKEGDPSPTLTAGDRHGVMCMNPWDAQSARVYDQDGAWHSLNANENGGMARDSVLCAGFKLGNSEQARSIGYQEELSPTLNAECGGNKPAVVALDMTHACDVIRECGEQVPALQARMGTGGNQVPLTYQMNGFGDYRAAEVASSCKQRDFKDSTDLVCAVDFRNFREGGEINGTLQAKEGGGQSLNLNNTVRQNMVVRRLTPMECERLQGFPDRWTDIGEWIDGKGKRHKPSDSPRYKALGNSIALPFWDWMLRRMARYLPERATLGSLFDGIGGFPLCWERIHGKGTARWASEIEPFPIAVTKKWFGEE
jgi:DNA (cytosine-5)-methyltransferase 1